MKKQVPPDMQLALPFLLKAHGEKQNSCPQVETNKIVNLQNVRDEEAKKFLQKQLIKAGLAC